MNKKAQGISINVVIVAAIALLVLVVLSVIFIGRLGLFSSSVGECENKGGVCVLANENCPDDKPQPFTEWSCPDLNEEPQKCCIGITA